MAIQACPECGKDVSTQAPACPNCGFPIAAPVTPAAAAPQPHQFVPPPTKTTNPWMIIGWILLAVILLPLATCAVFFGGTVKDGYNEYRERSEANRPPAP